MKQEIISLWQERIADKEASGLKLKKWCVQNQLTTHGYYLRLEAKNLRSEQSWVRCSIVCGNSY